MLCGWMEPSEWAPSLFAESPFDIDNAPYSPPICPGWTLRQPLIAEIAEAWRVYEKGCLDTFFPDPAHVLLEGVLILDASITAHNRKERETRDG